ncbi:deoxyribose-phosphate aldolase [Catenisphaera adipataccumulans]|jgi:deoxyribose-phosphate aldolase|uniref:Deoxyribose-phosphate aldolase n=1 Tax=Catenisphaera adipataccumulans TaxID=700500 RepID=A0A7W8FWZ1_9FIRM|nr:deoxyribose-phosphate aldolase [Catenisphaera adipataccumulans]MBB5183115.1 deoxyribose-phosphate aldolase [Catenisphaera adipataccumulans]
MKTQTVAHMIDHTYLKAFATQDILQKLCDEAKAMHTASVAVSSAWTPFCHEQLKGTGVHVTSVVAFPLGQGGLDAKKYEVMDAIAKGADEVDYVLDIGRVKMQDHAYIENEMRTLTTIVHNAGKKIKVILETCYLEPSEIQWVCKIAVDVRPDFVKTSTGFGTGGATVGAVRLMKDTVGDAVEVKASGGIRDWKTCKAMIDAGATRIGTSSGTKILEELEKENA